MSLCLQCTTFGWKRKKVFGVFWDAKTMCIIITYNNGGLLTYNIDENAHVLENENKS